MLVCYNVAGIIKSICYIITYKDIHIMKNRCKDYLVAFGVWLRLWRTAGMPIYYTDTKLREAENYSRLLYNNLSLEEWNVVKSTLDKCPKDSQGVIL